MFTDLYTVAALYAFGYVGVNSGAIKILINLYERSYQASYLFV